MNAVKISLLLCNQSAQLVTIRAEDSHYVDFQVRLVGDWKQKANAFETVNAKALTAGKFVHADGGDMLMFVVKVAPKYRKKMESEMLKVSKEASRHITVQYKDGVCWRVFSATTVSIDKPQRTSLSVSALGPDWMLSATALTTGTNDTQMYNDALEIIKSCSVKSRKPRS